MKKGFLVHAGKLFFHGVHGKEKPGIYLKENIEQMLNFDYDNEEGGKTFEFLFDLER